MNKSLYISPLCLEILLCSQENINIYLPIEDTLNTAEDNDILYGIQEFVNAGVLAPDSSGNGFDILSEARKCLRPIINPKAVLTIITKEPQSSKVCYLANNEATVIEDAVNRSDKLRLTMTDRKSFSALVAESFYTISPETISEDSKLMDEVSNLSESDSVDSEILKIGLNNSTEEVAEKDEIVMVTDIFKPDFKIFSRIIVYRTGLEDRFAVFSDKHSPECFECDFNVFINRFDLILEDLLC